MLRRLHDDYKVSKSTPPASLESDVRELTAAAVRMRLERSRGRTPPADPSAQALIRSRWDEYRSRVDFLFEDIRAKRDGGASDSRVYWESLKAHENLAAAVEEDLAYNTPPGERSLEEAVAKDRWELLKRLEDPARTRGRAACIVAPGEHALSRAVDPGPFYRAAGLLPGTNPLRTESFEVPAGCRTVVQREADLKLIFRASAGRGTLVIGSESRPLAYDYATVLPDTPYFIENAGDGPLQVDFIALQP